MIIITRPDISDDELDHIRERVESAGLHTHLSRGEHRTIIGCIGDESRLPELPLRTRPVSSFMSHNSVAFLQFALDWWNIERRRNEVNN